MVFILGVEHGTGHHGFDVIESKTFVDWRQHSLRNVPCAASEAIREFGGGQAGGAAGQGHIPRWVITSHVFMIFQFLSFFLQKSFESDVNK